jgi:large subunit ribosomal protein L5
MADEKKKKKGGDEGEKQAPKAKPQMDEAEIAKKHAERAAKKAGKGGGAAQAQEEVQTTVRSRVRPACACFFEKELAAQLKKELGLENPMEVPRIKKITINMGLGEAISNPTQLSYRYDGLRY